MSLYDKGLGANEDLQFLNETGRPIARVPIFIRKKGNSMKKFILPALLVLLSVPTLSFAQGQQGDQNCQGQQPGPGCGTKRIGATEMELLGATAAALIGLTGFLVIRRRKSA